ncbi:MAG: HDOD domain-containing protein [Psychrobium sp.]|nr:HDOD domain-containing protein [Psychrobium sp.]
MDFNALVRSIKTLPSLPQAYHKCCALLDNDICDSNELASVVRSDAAMTLAVLRLVNSAFYNMPRKIERVEHAISIVGQTKFRDLILSAAVVTAMSKLARGEIDMAVYWRHSVFTGLLARRIGLYSYLANSERMFIAGLLHDVGQLIYFNMQATQAMRVTELVSKLGVNSIVAEEKVLGYNHLQIGAALCEQWQLPQWLIESIKYHYEPQLSKHYQLEATVLHLANHIASFHYPSLTSLGKLNKDEIVVETNNVWRFLNFNQDIIVKVTEDATAELETVLASLIPELSTA